MQVIAHAGVYTPAADNEPNHWVEHLVANDLSVGTYSIPAGGLDDQRPHYEDEIYVVQTGAATLVTGSGSAEVGPGSVLFVPAREKHQFTDIREDLTLIVIVAPPYKSRERAEAGQSSAAAAGAASVSRLIARAAVVRSDGRIGHRRVRCGGTRAGSADRAARLAGRRARVGADHQAGLVDRLEVPGRDALQQ